MFWADAIVRELQHNEILNDSKTPSGRVHIGALRGVLIHDVVYTILKQQGKNPQFFYGVDDYDPMDEIGFELDASWREHMGKPLVHVPSPDGTHTALSDYYMNEFLEVMHRLNIHPQIYKMSEYYKSGKMNDLIATILDQSRLVRQLYYDISGSRKADTWVPFQVICERCGKLGSTIVSGFDGKEVRYSCSPSLVRWAEGCGYEGKTSPFDGRGKLPWKLEWIAKWKLLSVSVEGAGKDHSSQGGARDVANAIYRAIFQQAPPHDLPYEFFLVGKKKMSSSKGIGLSSKDLVDVLPPELVRFLMVRYNPQTVIDFHPEGETIPKLYDEYDRCAQLYCFEEGFSKRADTCSETVVEDGGKEVDGGTEVGGLGDDRGADRAAEALQSDKAYAWRAFELAQVDAGKHHAHWRIRFSTLTALVQSPQINVTAHATQLKGSALSESELQELDSRKNCVQLWLQLWASDEYRFSLLHEDDMSCVVSVKEQGFVRAFLAAFEYETLSSEAIHQCVYELSGAHGLKAKEGFQLMYRLFIGKDQGPRLGAFLHALDKNFVCRRLHRVVGSFAS